MTKKKKRPFDFNAEEQKTLLGWARRAMRGLPDSDIFVGVLGTEELSAARIEFLLHIGHCVLSDKLIIIPVPHGVPVPKKLAAIADKIVYYNPADPDSLQNGLGAAFVELGIRKQ